MPQYVSGTASLSATSSPLPSSAGLRMKLSGSIWEQEWSLPGHELRHEVFVLNAVLSSVAFLESAVNELYADATDEAYFFADEQHEALLHRISDGWKNTKNFDRAPALTKYQKILALAGQPVFGEDDRAFENVRDLVEIRNYLVHFRREWIPVSRDRARETAGESATEKFEKVLRKKFAANPLAAKNAPFFPDKCLGHGCAEWAIVNSLIFVDEFFHRLRLPVPYEGMRDELATR